MHRYGHVHTDRDKNFWLPVAREDEVFVKCAKCEFGTIMTAEEARETLDPGPDGMLDLNSFLCETCMFSPWEWGQVNLVHTNSIITFREEKKGEFAG